jgi:predicted porin
MAYTQKSIKEIHMNRKLLALAVTAALAAPMAAQAAPTVYGQLNLSVDMVMYDDGVADYREVQVNSNSSRLGVKGEEALGNGYSAVYKAEWGVSLAMWRVCRRPESA